MSLGDNGAADPTLENPCEIILFSEAERNGQNCFVIHQPPALSTACSSPPLLFPFPPHTLLRNRITGSGQLLLTPPKPGLSCLSSLCS